MKTSKLDIVTQVPSINTCISIKKNNAIRSTGDTGMLLNSQACKSLINIQKISQIILASFKGNLHTKVISYYGLINHHQELGVEGLYQDIRFNL